VPRLRRRARAAPALPARPDTPPAGARACPAVPAPVVCMAPCMRRHRDGPHMQKTRSWRMQARRARLPRPWSRPRRSRGQCLRCAPGGRRSCRCRPLGRRAPAAAAQQRLRTLSAAAAATRTAARSRMRRRPLRAPEGSDPPLAACNKVAPCSQSHTQVVGEACRRLRPRSPGALPTSWSWTSGLPRWPLCGRACCSGAG